MQSIKFPTSVSVGVFDKYYVSSFVDSGELNRQLCFDFSKSEFVEMTTWQMVTSIFAWRDSLELETIIALPAGEKGKQARDAIRAWDWQSAITTVLARPFVSVVLESDKVNFKGTGGDSGPTRYHISPNARRTIPFHTWEVERYRDKLRMADEILELPEFQPIIRVLNKRLSTKPDAENKTESGNFVMSRIVFEAMTNAIRHPGAKFIQTSSTIQGNPKKGESFSLSFWDDGQSMWDTLKQVVSSGVSIRSSENPKLKTFYELNCPNCPKLDKQILTSNKLPSQHSPAEHFLLATLFPGVTSDLSGKGERYHQSLKEQEPELAKLGMGLYSLVRAACNTFSGSVAFRTPRLFMNITGNGKRDGQYCYKAKFMGNADRDDGFLGNLITVRLPLVPVVQGASC